MVQAQAVLAEQSQPDNAGQSDGVVTDLMLGDVLRPVSTLEIPSHVPF